MKVLLSNLIMNPTPISQRENSPGRSNYAIQNNFNFRDIKPFDWHKRWLKGDQYAHILRNIDLYCKKYGFQKFQYKTHPQSIYKNPINGMIYFVKGKGVGSDFGFPRVNAKKKYRWKKMNFTTDLPKKNPHVTYVVASAMKANVMQNEFDLPDFRMHAVIPYNSSLHKGDISQSEYILCHVREVQHRKHQQQEEVSIQTCFTNQRPDFYKLFSFLHNLEHNHHLK